MAKAKNFAGAIAGLAMVIIGLSTITKFMRNFYELFYALHIIMFILIMIMVGMHRPKFSSSTLIIVIFTACLWVLDRIIRAAKIIWNIFGNSATVTILPNNTVRVKLGRRVQSRPGFHAFLWLPAIRLMETHPFTMLSSNNTEFVIRVYDGFTHDLYKAAEKAPGKSMRCSVDGGYGQVPDFNVFDKAVLVAGGSGASFTFAIALDLVKKSASKVKAIDFVWIVRNRESIEWFAQELKKLQSHSRVNVLIHVTHETDLSCEFSQTSPMPPGEKTCVENNVVPATPSTLVSPVSDLEKGGFENTSVQTSSLLNEVRPGRPDIGNLIAAAASSAGKPDDRIIVGACGPEGLIDATQRAIVRGLHDDGPSITLYTEEFKW